MWSLVLEKIASGLLPVTTLFALVLLLQGHDHPGGGFIAGLVTASAFVLQALAFGTSRARLRLASRVRPALPLGLALALLSAMAGPLASRPFFTHASAGKLAGLDVALSTTLLFDVGVYLVVVGTTVTVLAAFSDPQEER